jgi:hypothetical protein
MGFVVNEVVPEQIFSEYFCYAGKFSLQLIHVHHPALGELAYEWPA